MTATTMTLSIETVMVVAVIAADDVFRHRRFPLDCAVVHGQFVVFLGLGRTAFDFVIYGRVAFTMHEQ